MSLKSEMLIKDNELKCTEIFKKIDEIAYFNQKKVLDAFRAHSISSRHLVGTTGYGYDDVGRDNLGRVFASVFGAEAAIVSPLIASGTHALTISLFGILRPGDLLLTVTGKPYDTLDDVIFGENVGSLKDFGINYKSIELKNDTLDMQNIFKSVEELRPKVVFLQRSQGYEWRSPITVDEIKVLAEKIHHYSPNSVFMIDNAYGEFTSNSEPSEVGADVVIGSLIKNCGGGFAPTGAYIVGKTSAIEQIGYRLTTSSVGTEVGSYLNGYLSFYEGLFIAPRTVANALKASVLSGFVLDSLGFESSPQPGSLPNDIIRAIKFNNEEKLITFCKAVQAASPIDSYLTPEPWDMPGYNHKVIMSAGTFVQGASLELTADAPIKPPYIGYLQGALTYEHAKIALSEIVDALSNEICI